VSPRRLFRLADRIRQRGRITVRGADLDRWEEVDRVHCLLNVALAHLPDHKWLDLSLTSEDNPNTPVLAERMGAKLYKRYRVYRLHIGKLEQASEEV